MRQSHQEVPKAIKFLRDDEELEVASRRIESDGIEQLPKGVFFQTMVVLEKPEEIKPKKKK